MSSATTKRTKRTQRLSYGARVDLFYFAIFALTFAFLLIAADQIVSRVLENRDQRALYGEVARQADHIARFGALANDEPAATHVFAVRVSSSANITLARSGSAQAPLEQLGSASGSGVEVRTIKTENEVQWRIASKRLSGNQHLHVGVSDALRRQTLAALRTSYAWVIGIAAALGLLGGTFLRKQALKPVHELAEATRHVIERGDFSVRVQTRGTADEIDHLAELFNQMLARNQSLVERMREALDNVAHDLRTPLTHIRGVAELSLRKQEAESREALSDILEESESILAMLQSLMDVAEAEAGTLTLHREEVDLSQLAAEVVDIYEMIADERQIKLKVHAQPELVAFVDRPRVRQALANLVDNALKYCRAGDTVTVEATRQGSKAVLRVRDDGPGIPAEQQSRIWERLYRGNDSRSTKGLGLGLSLVRAIAQAHGGEATVKSEIGRGSTFSLFFESHPTATISSSGPTS